MISLTLDIEPVAASRPRFTGKGRAYTAAPYRQFKTMVSYQLKALYKRAPLTGPLKAVVLFFLEKPKSVKRAYPAVKPDIDNYLKAVFDAGNEILWEDDAQIVDLSTYKRYGKPKIQIIVSELNEGELT